MKKNKLYIASVAFAALSLVTSCDSFLDKLPDDRAEVNTEEKVTSLLVSAYPTASSNQILEWSSDNYADNGKQYSTNQEIEQIYRFQPIQLKPMIAQRVCGMVIIQRLLQPTRLWLPLMRWEILHR